MAAALRLAAVGFGEPAATCRPDEQFVIHEALFLLAGDPHVHFPSYPPGLPIIEAAWFRLATLAGELPPEGLVAYALEPFEFHRIGRVLTALFGIATVLIVALIARRLVGRLGSVLAGCALAVMPLHVVNSCFVKLDVPGTCLLFAALLPLIRGDGKHPGLRAMAFAGALAGAAAAIKFPFGVVLLSVVFVALRSPGRRRWAMVAVALTACAATFLVLAPTFVLDPGGALAGLRAEFATQSIARAGWGGPAPALYLARLALGYGTGFGFMALGALALCFLRRVDPRIGLLLIPASALFVMHCAVGNVYTRYAIPVLPALAVLVSAVPSALPRFRTLAMLAVVAACMLPAWRSLGVVRVLRERDTRAQLLDAFADGSLPRDRVVLTPGGLFAPFPEATYLRAFAKRPADLSSGCEIRARIIADVASAIEASGAADGFLDVRLLDAANAEATLASLGARRALVVVPTMFPTESTPLGADGLEGLRDEQTTMAEGGWRVRLLARFDPTGGAGFPGREHWDLADHWFVPSTDPSLVERPGPLIEVFGVDPP